MKQITVLLSLVLNNYYMKNSKIYKLLKSLAAIIICNQIIVSIQRTTFYFIFLHYNKMCKNNSIYLRNIVISSVNIIIWTYVR